MTYPFTLVNEDATVKFGECLARSMDTGGVIFLSGSLGAGKTTLTRGILRGFGHRAAVKSPTYTLVEPYDFGHKSVFHFDLYRLGDPEELEYMGIRDYFSDRDLCIVEWPERGRGILPQADMTIELQVFGLARQALLQANSIKGQNAIKKICQQLG